MDKICLFLAASDLYISVALKYIYKNSFKYNPTHDVYLKYKTYELPFFTHIKMFFFFCIFFQNQFFFLKIYNGKGWGPECGH